MVSYKIGVCKVSPKGKECKTTFQKLSYDGKSSVVLCKPLTGRMHQIRVHLQYLGKQKMQKSRQFLYKMLFANLAFEHWTQYIYIFIIFSSL